MDRLSDRTRAVTDWKCPRARYLGYEFAGRGVSSLQVSFPLTIGGTIHDFMEGLTFGEDPDTVCETLTDSFMCQIEEVRDNDPYFFAEQTALVEGMMRGFAKYQWKKLHEQYERVHTAEMETVIKLCVGHKFMVKPDVLFIGKDGNLHYIEGKSTSSNKEQWVNSWRLNPQLHIYAEALRRCGIKVDTVTVQGFYKGWYNTYKKVPFQDSRFCYGYRRTGQPPFNRDEWSYVYRAGFYKTPVWEEYPGGVKAWVKKMPKQVLADQFIQTPPIVPNRRIADAFFRQRAYREAEITDAMKAIALVDNGKSPKSMQMLLDTHFPQHFDQCTPGWGEHCPFVGLCHGPEDIDPLTVGYRWREPHHKPEADQFEEKKQALVEQEIERGG